MESEEWLLLVCGYNLDVRASADFITVVLTLFHGSMYGLTLRFLEVLVRMS